MGIWLTPLGNQHNGFQLQIDFFQSICSINHIINTWADIIIRSNLDMHERNSHNFPLDLAAVEVSSI